MTEKLETDLEALKKQADEYLAGWKRAKADLVNLQNEVARERAEWVEFATARCLGRMLPLVDTVQAALAHEPALAEVGRMFDEFLAGEGVAPIACEGLYDPGRHEVVGREKREGTASGTILTCAQRGFTLFGKVLRPAKVIVSE